MLLHPPKNPAHATAWLVRILKPNMRLTQNLPNWLTGTLGNFSAGRYRLCRAVDPKSFLQIRIQLLFSMRIRIQLRYKFVCNIKKSFL